MISLTCTSCKRVLEIDDAFAGGVCRCRHCGTIQTVPSSLKPPARPGAPASSQPTVTAAKTLYQRPRRGDEASADTSSEASSPATAPIRAAAPQARAARTPSVLLMRAAIAAAVLLAAIIVIVLWLMIR